MQLNKIDDPRDRLAKARRSELARYAHANGHKTFSFNGHTFDAALAPAEITRHYLRSIGLTNPPIPNRVLGQPNQPHGNARQSASNAPAMAGKGVEVSALADLARQAAQESRAAPAGDTKPLKDMSINELRATGTGLGIKFERRDNMKTMREKIEAKQNG